MSPALCPLKDSAYGETRVVGMGLHARSHFAFQRLPIGCVVSGIRSWFEKQFGGTAFRRLPAVSDSTYILRGTEERESALSYQTYRGRRR